jgi:hypothetical protein
MIHDPLVRRLALIGLILLLAALYVTGAVRCGNSNASTR